jgi:hypothetical protein
MKIPTQLTTNKEKLKFLLRVKSKIIEEHNLKGADFREKKITETEFRKYQKENFEPRLEKLLAQLNGIKEDSDMVRNYNENPEIKSQNLVELEQLKEEAKSFNQYDHLIDLTKI